MPNIISHQGNAYQNHEGTSLVVQWLRLQAPTAGGPGYIPGQGTRSRMPQLKDPTRGKEDPVRHD